MNVLLATRARSEKVSALLMASKFISPPPPKKVLTARLTVEVHTKIDNVVDLWRARAKAEGQGVEQQNAIDKTFVVERLLAAILDDELQHWGGNATTPEAKVAQLKAVADATAQVAAKKSR